MTYWLRQSTAGQELPLGPFLDDTDGKTAETALTIANTDIKIWKDGATAVVNKSSGGATHMSNGNYYAVFDATDSNIVGSFRVDVHVAGALPVQVRAIVLPANVYDSFINGTDKLQVDTVQVGGTVQTARDIGASVLISGTKTTLDALNDISTADVSTQVNSSIVTYRLDHLMHTAVVGADVTDNTVIAKLVSKAATADWDTFNNTTDSVEALRDRGDAAWVGGGGASPQLLQSTTIATLASQTSFTLTAGSADNNAYNKCLVVITDQTTSTQKAVGFVSGYVGATKTVTLKTAPIFTIAVGDSIDIIVANDQEFPSNFADMAIGIGTGWITVGTNQDKTDYEILGTKTTLDDLNDVAATSIVSNGAITTLAGAVVNVDTVDTVNTAAIADAVWDEPRAGHTTAGTFGFYLDAQVSTIGGGTLTEAGIADAVWDELLSGHLGSGSVGEALSAAGASGDPWITSLPGAYSAGQAGYIIGNNINATISSRASQSTADAIVADTNEVQTDLANGGRLDLLIDAILADTTEIGAAGAGLTAIASQSSVNTLATYVDTEVAAILAAVDTEIAAIKAKTDSLTFTDAGKVDATIQIAADIKAVVANKIADHIIRRSLASALISGDGDTKTGRSLAGAISKQVNRVALTGGVVNTYETDDATVLLSQNVTTDQSAAPITSVDTI